MNVVAVTLAAVLSLIALLHLYWSNRGVVPNVSVPSHADGSPVIRPGRAASLAVALALVLAAVIVLGRAGLWDVGLPSVLLRLGTWAIAAVFAARTIGEFRYVGLFRRVRDTPFARWDTWLFTPLCVGLAVAAAAIAAA